MDSNVFVLCHLCTFLLTPPAVTAVHFGRQLTKAVMPVRCQPLTTEDWGKKKMVDSYLILASTKEVTEVTAVRCFSGGQVVE